jgi:hypothetical protein
MYIKTVPVSSVVIMSRASNGWMNSITDEIFPWTDKILIMILVEFCCDKVLQSALNSMSFGRMPANPLNNCRSLIAECMD